VPTEDLQTLRLKTDEILVSKIIVRSEKADNAPGTRRYPYTNEIDKI